MCSYRVRGLLWIAAPVLLLVSVVDAGQWRVDQDDFNAHRPPQLAVTGTGRAVVAYYDEEGMIRVRPQGAAAVAVNTRAGRGKPSGLVLYAAGQRLYAAWRESRSGVASLWLRASPDGGLSWPQPEVMVDNTTQPLKRIVLAGDASGKLHVAWLGERETKLSAAPGIVPVTPQSAERSATTGKSYHVYTRFSADGGASWGASYRLTDGYRESIWPTLIARGERAYSFSWSQREGRKLLLFTKTENGSDWQTPLVIDQVGDVLLLEPCLLDDRLLVVWLSQYPGKGYLIEGAVSPDEGGSWHRFTLPDSLGLDVANIDVTADGDKVYIAFSARRKSSTETSKFKIYFSRSLDGARNWSNLTNLSHYPFSHTQTVYPRIIADSRVLVVWNDFRNIRGDLYYNFSDNAGLSWQLQDIPVSTRGRRNDYLYPFNQALAKTDAGYYLLAGRYSSDALTGPAELWLYDFTPAIIDPPRDLLADTGSAAKTAMLEQRAQHFWERLRAADYEAVYELFDPFYRASHRKIDYLAATGRIRFNSFQFKNIVVAGNLGSVLVEYEYEIPTFRTRQGKVSRPPTQVSRAETWLFVDGDWYKEYRNELGEFSFARY